MISLPIVSVDGEVRVRNAAIRPGRVPSTCGLTQHDRSASLPNGMIVSGRIGHRTLFVS